MIVPHPTLIKYSTKLLGAQPVFSVLCGNLQRDYYSSADIKRILGKCVIGWKNANIILKDMYKNKYNKLKWNEPPKPKRGKSSIRWIKWNQGIKSQKEIQINLPCTFSPSWKNIKKFCIFLNNFEALWLLLSFHN